MITSRSNSSIKLISQLRNSRNRRDSDLFFVEGIKPVGDAFTAGWDLEFIVYSPELLHSQFALETVAKAKSQNFEIIEVSEDVFRYLSEKDGPQGIGAVVHSRFQALETIQANGGVWIGLDSVQNAGNLGTIIRTADAAGAAGIILIGNCVDPFSTEAVRSSMGAIFAVKIIRVDLESFLAWHQDKHFEIVGTSDKSALDFKNTSYDKNMILLMGSEQKGMQPDLAKICSKIVSIPMRGTSDSLNLAVATGIILYEVMSRLHNDISGKGGKR